MNRPVSFTNTFDFLEQNDNNALFSNHAPSMQGWAPLRPTPPQVEQPKETLADVRDQKV